MNARLAAMRKRWAAKRSPYLPFVGRRVEGTDLVNKYEGILTFVGKTGQFAVITDDQGPKHIVWLDTVKAVFR